MGNAEQVHPAIGYKLSVASYSPTAPRHPLDWEVGWGASYTGHFLPSQHKLELQVCHGRGTDEGRQVNHSLCRVSDLTPGLNLGFLVYKMFPGTLGKGM